MPQTVDKSFWYKRCVFKLKHEGQDGAEVSLGNDQQLSHLLLRAIERADAEGRSQFDLEDRDVCHFINECEALPANPEVVCGDFLGFEKGRPQIIIQTTSGVQHYPITAVPPKDGTQNGDIPAIFVAYRNHVALMTSGKFGSNQLEQYLRWFLTEKTRVLPDTHQIYLMNPMSTFDSATLGVRKIEMNVITENSVSEDTVEDALNLNEQNSLIAKAFDKVMQLMGEDQAYDEINQALRDKRLRLSIQLSMRPPKREEVQANLDGVATLMRHHIRDVKLFTKGGGTWKNNHLYIMDRVPCDLSESGTFARLDIGIKLKNWLFDLNNRGKIDFGL